MIRRRLLSMLAIAALLTLSASLEPSAVDAATGHSAPFPGDFNCPPGSPCTPTGMVGTSVTVSASPGLFSFAPGDNHPIPTGNVTFSLGSTVLAVKALVNGTTSFTTTSLPAGHPCVTVSWPGDSYYDAPSPQSYCYWFTDTPSANNSHTGISYRLIAKDGGAFDYDITSVGSAGAIKLAAPIVGAATTPTRNGYWSVASDGGIFAFGDAKFYGSTGGSTINQPIVAMAATPTGNGYWLVAADGGVFSYGDALFYGSTGSIKLNKPIVAMAATPSGHGYWLLASDGGIFAYGDAGFYGSTGAIKLNQPIVGMAASPTGAGYQLVASDGGIFAYGDAGFYGSTGSTKLNQPIVGISATTAGHGYWLVAADGGIFCFGDASFQGSAGGTKLNQPIVTMIS